MGPTQDARNRPLMQVWNAQNMLFLSTHIGSELRQKQRGRDSQADFGHFVPVLEPALHRRQPDEEHRQSELRLMSSIFEH